MPECASNLLSSVAEMWLSIVGVLHAKWRIVILLKKAERIIVMFVKWFYSLRVT